MKAKLIVEGKEFDIEILDPKMQEIIAPTKKTGYERVDENNTYFIGSVGCTQECIELYRIIDDKCYESANYYSDQTVAENNARADKLMRQLRRFAVEHRKNKLNWENICQCKYYILYDYEDCKFTIDYMSITKDAGVIYFDAKETANLALKTFRDELLWYFTEYKDSL